ncbi:MAG TPA: OmpH family outer membrane protein, partial [Verrucomicrobiae bacterium]|nr:OmpH family outer membrane protein [Verrucomicrobiae bacterium]
MRNSLRRLIPLMLLMSLLGGSAWAQTRIGTVDLRKVFENYWKKKQAEAQLKDRQADMEKEDKNMLEDYKKMKDEYQNLLSSANDQAVSPEERDKRKKAAEDKLKQMKDLEDTIRQYETQARNTLLDQSQRTRAKIIEEIKNVVGAKARAAGFSLVIDTAAESANATPVVLFTNNENDITDVILKELNAAAPTDTAKPEEKPA